MTKKGPNKICRGFIPLEARSKGAADTRRVLPRTGFTLVETIVVSAVMAAAMGAVAVLYMNFNIVLGTGVSVKAAAEDASRVMQEAEALISTSSGVLASYSFSGTTHTSATSTLVLELPAVDASGNPIANAYDYAAVYQTGSTTSRILSAHAGSARVSGTKKLGGTVSSLTFTYDSADKALVESVDVDVRTVVVSRGKSNPAHLRGKVYLRNN